MTVPRLLTLTWKDGGQWFDFFFQKWDQIDNTQPFENWDYPNFILSYQTRKLTFNKKGFLKYL